MIQKIKRKNPVKKTTKSELTKKDKVDTKKEISFDLGKASAKFSETQVSLTSKTLNKTTEVESLKKIDNTETAEKRNSSTEDEENISQNSFFEIEEIIQPNLFNQEEKLEQALAILQG